ncbi:DKNYY domain-containing protein [Bradymonas sediminis]|nr:DKNYY domain-containing protein [Bradymonas sediminis]TDP75236.1 DKNYY family protein [Bradymonas sediminis]
MPRLGRILTLLGCALLSLISTSCSPLGEPVAEGISSGYYFSRWGDEVFFSAEGNWLGLGKSVVEGADRESFRPLSEHLAVDRARVYYRQYPQPQVDRDSFRVQGRVWQDDAHIYYARSRDTRLRVVEGADPEMFRYLFPEAENPTDWARDAEHYYLRHKAVEVDVDSFRILNETFVADRDSIYRNNTLPLARIVEVSGPIEQINDFHLRMGDQIISAGSWAFEVVTFDAIDEVRAIGTRVLVLNGQVYEKGKLLREWDGDAASLTTWPDNPYYAHDAGAVYALRPVLKRVEGADLASFEPAQDYGAYATDARRVYFNGRHLKDADRATFAIGRDADGVFAHDKHGRFMMGIRP